MTIEQEHKTRKREKDSVTHNTQPEKLVILEISILCNSESNVRRFYWSFKSDRCLMNIELTKDS